MANWLKLADDIMRAKRAQARIYTLAFFVALDKGVKIS
jgi:hypothetical protein